MLINPETAIQNGWITHPECDTMDDWTERKFLGTNAIDFTIDDLHSIDAHTEFVISNDAKTMRGGSEQFVNSSLYWTLNANTSYDGMSDMHVNVPEGVACELIIRSSFNRNGIFLTAGVFDSGYSGAIGFALHNMSGLASIRRGTRIGQIKFIQSNSNGVYAGGYNHLPGTHWSASIGAATIANGHPSVTTDIKPQPNASQE